MSAAERNKTAVSDCFANASRGNYDALEAIISPSYVLHPGEVSGVEGLREWVEGNRRALPDLRVTIEHQVAEGDASRPARRSATRTRAS